MIWLMFVMGALLAPINFCVTEEPLYEEKCWEEEDECLEEETVLNDLLRYRMVDGLVHGSKVTFEVERIHLKDSGGNEMWLRRGEVAEAFRDLLEEATQEGFEIRLNESYRTPEQQRAMWKSKDYRAADPVRAGERSHMTGYAIDVARSRRLVNGKYRKTLLFWWLKKNAKRFGFHHSVEGEPWHLIYLGPSY